MARGVRRRRVRKDKDTIRSNGIVYVLRVDIDGKIVYKVGCTMHTVRLRVMQLIEGIEKVYGYFPRVEVIKAEGSKWYYQVESQVHRELSECKYVSVQEFDGHTELFDCSVDKVVEVYRRVIDAGECVDDVDRIQEW